MELVPKETFQGYDTDSKLTTVYDLLGNIYKILDCRKEHCIDQLNICDIRLKKIEKGQTKWKLVSGTVAAISGGVGGALAWLTSKFYIGS